MQLTVEEIARICHAANRAYCEALGDDSQVSWEEFGDRQKQPVVNGVMAHMGWLSKGMDVAPSLSHQLWVDYMTSEGWKYGPVKDSEKKEHPMMLAWDDLPDKHKGKDILFSAIVKACVEMGAAEV